MRRSDPEYLVVGHVNKAHGTKGDLFVWPLTDHPEGTFAPGVVLHVADETGDEPDPGLPTVQVRAVRPFRKGLLVTLEGVETRDGADAFHGKYLLRPREEVEERGEGEVFYHELLGMTVVTVDGVEVGEIVEVYELRPADLLEVRGAARTHFIPFLESLVERLDVENRTLVIDPPEGLLDL